MAFTSRRAQAAYAEGWCWAASSAASRDELLREFIRDRTGACCHAGKAQLPVAQPDPERQRVTPS